MMVTLLFVLGGCSEESHPQSSDDLPDLNPSYAASDQVAYTLTIDGVPHQMATAGGGGPNRIEGPDCASSFWLPFFRGLGGGIPYEEPVSYIDVRLSGYEPGSASLVPTLDDRIDLHWVAPHWRIDGEIRGVFGGTAILEAYGPDGVALVFEETTMCTLPVWGRVDYVTHEHYSELATDCVPVEEVRLEALPDVGSDVHIGDEWAREGEGRSWSSAWRNLEGELLCH